MQRLLITGASGFLGRRIAEYYKDRYDIFTPSHQEMDIVNEKAVEKVFLDYKPDMVVHCAAISDIGECEKYPEESYKINVMGSENIAKASFLMGAKCILCSSDQVYFGSEGSKPYQEEECLKPGNLYGRQKLEAEERCLKANPNCVLLRLSMMYDLQVVYPKDHNAFGKNLKNNLPEGEFMYPVYDKRGITDVKEVIRNIEKTFSIPGGIYNFGAPNEMGTYELMRAVFEEAGFDFFRIKKNEESFSKAPRNLTMCQKKCEAAGIIFRDTKKLLIENLEGLKFDYNDTIDGRNI